MTMEEKLDKCELSGNNICRCNINTTTDDLLFERSFFVLIFQPLFHMIDVDYYARTWTEKKIQTKLPKLGIYYM